MHEQQNESRPNGVLKVHNCELASSSFSCQKPSFISITLNTRLPLSFADMSSNVGMGSARAGSHDSDLSDPGIYGESRLSFRRKQTAHPFSRLVSLLDNTIAYMTVEKLLQLELYRKCHLALSVNHRFDGRIHDDVMFARHTAYVDKHVVKLMQQALGRRHWFRYIEIRLCRMDTTKKINFSGEQKRSLNDCSAI